jgi:hypothetical protein
VQVAVLLGGEDSFTVRTSVVSVKMGLIIYVLNFECWEPGDHILPGLDYWQRLTAYRRYRGGGPEVEVKIGDGMFAECYGNLCNIVGIGGRERRLDGCSRTGRALSRSITL